MKKNKPSPLGVLITALISVVFSVLIWLLVRFIETGSP